MTKAEKLIENYEQQNHEDEDFVMKPNVLSAMEEQSIKFAEFLQNECHYTGAGEYFYLKTHKEHTTYELYKLFNEL